MWQLNNPHIVRNENDNMQYNQTLYAMFFIQRVHIVNNAALYNIHALCCILAVEHLLIDPV